jgi:ABC-2 type transport system permease protein
LTILAPVLLIGTLFFGCFEFACFGIILSAPPTDMPSTIMMLSFLVKFPLLFISPIFIPIAASPWTVFSPLTPFIDLVNYSFSGSSYFGSWGILIDIGILALWTAFFLTVGLLLHKKTLYKRFKG